MNLLDYYKKLAKDYANEIASAKSAEEVITITNTLKDYIEFSESIATKKGGNLDNRIIEEFEQGFKRACNNTNGTIKR